MLYSGTDPESYITKYTLVYDDKKKGESTGVDEDAARLPSQGLRVHRPRVVPGLDCL